MPENTDTEAYISRPKMCDVHAKQHEAQYDAAVLLVMADGVSRRIWANVCEDIFHTCGGHLGLGRGQRLIVQKED